MYVLPKQIVYIVDRYKIEACFVYGFVALALLMLLLFLFHNHVQQLSVLPYTEIKYPIVAMPSVTTAQYAQSTTSVWPIHGIVTTQFGASDRPFQSSHTGIDISSAKPAGVTPVTTFRAGTVVQVIHSNVSFGNHVIVDHGNGLTSLYGHLANTTVSVGQHVIPGDTLGHEGSTGASTGPHLHFEIDLNGKPVNPRGYLTGNP